MGQKIMLPKTLDTAPLPAPTVRSQPEGRPVSFEALVRSAGMRNVVTVPRLPDIRIHGGNNDFKVPRPGATTFCIGGSTLPSNARERAREVLRRLAYEFGEYAAREIVSRYHRDLKAEAGATVLDEEARVARRLLTPTTMKIRRALRQVSEANVSDLAEATGLAQPNVSRAIADLVQHGIVSTRKVGRSVLCSLVATDPSHSPGGSEPSDPWRP